MEKEARKAQEEEERARALKKTIMTHLGQPKPGQVWNPLAREYQDIEDAATDEHWRN